MGHPGMGDDLENCNPGTLHASHRQLNAWESLPSPRAVLTARITWGKGPCESSQFQGFPEASVVYSPESSFQSGRFQFREICCARKQMTAGF